MSVTGSIHKGPMPAPIRTRLSLSFLLVLFIGMGVAAVLAWTTVERLYLDTQRENLLAQARLTAEALRGAALSDLTSEPYSQTTNVLPGIHTHLLEEQDAVVLTLPMGPDTPSQRVPSAENSRTASAEILLQRSEITSALQGKPATAIRKVASADNQRVLYAAAPVYSDAGRSVRSFTWPRPCLRAGCPAAVIVQLAGIIILASLLALGAAALLSAAYRPAHRVHCQGGQSSGAGGFDSAGSSLPVPSGNWTAWAVHSMP